MGHHVDDQATIGVWLTGGLVVGTMIGAGIFMLPVALAPLGANAIIGWLVSIGGALSVAFALSRLARLGGGGMQSYIEQTFGPFAGYLVSWTFWFSNWVSVGAVAVAFGSAATRLFPVGGLNSITFLAVASILGQTAIAARGVRMSGGVNLVTVVIRLFPLLGVTALLAWRSASGVRLEPLATTPVTLANIGTATTLTLFAMLGFENATGLVGKVRNPSRTLPIAMLGGTMLVGFIYLLSSSGVALILRADALANSPAPYADVFASQGSAPLVWLAALCIAVAAFGSNLCLILVTGELGYAMAGRRQLPTVMARATGNGTPIVAIAVGSTLALIPVLANSNRTTAGLFLFLILLSTSGILVVYLVAALAAWRADRSPRVRLGIGIAILFIAFAFHGAGIEANLWALALLAAGTVNYVVMGLINARRLTMATAPTAPPAPVA